MRRRCSSLNTITWSVHSRRAKPIKRSTRPFCQGERKDVGRSRMPIARTRALNTAPNARSLSRMRYFGAVSQGNASVIWRANHWAVGLRVTANHSNCRRLWPRTRKTQLGDWLKQLPDASFYTAVVTLGFYTSARVAEQVRAGILRSRNAAHRGASNRLAPPSVSLPHGPPASERRLPQPDPDST
jgi:hypothetical protein